MDLANTISFAPALGSTSELKRPDRIHAAAQQFEALLISQMMKIARETNSDGWLSDGNETGEDSTMEMAEAQFAQAMAAQGGLGLAKTIVKAMTPAEAAPAAGQAIVTR
jgi:Rod binding domain-containing protein